MKKVTSMPAQRLGLKSVGRLECGYYADIVIFDMDRIQDCANYINPMQFPDGIEYVLIGGRTACRDGVLTDVRNGRLFIRK